MWAGGFYDAKTKAKIKRERALPLSVGCYSYYLCNSRRVRRAAKLLLGGAGRAPCGRAAPRGRDVYFRSTRGGGEPPFRRDGSRAVRRGRRGGLVSLRGLCDISLRAPEPL